MINLFVLDLKLKCAVQVTVRVRRVQQMRKTAQWRSWNESDFIRTVFTQKCGTTILERFVSLNNLKNMGIT